MYYTCIYIYTYIYTYIYILYTPLRLYHDSTYHGHLNCVSRSAKNVNEAAPKDFNATAPVPNQHLGYVYTSEIEPMGTAILIL